MIGFEMKMPESCEMCDLCTSDGDCMAMGGDSLWEFLPEDAPYFPNDWKCEKCPLVDMTGWVKPLVNISEEVRGK